MIEEEELNSILMDEFEILKVAFDEDGGYDDYPCSFYDEQFVPYIVKQLNEGNDKELEKIFKFIEMLFVEGDKHVVYVLDVSLVESLYFEPDFKKHRDKVFSLCGEKTRYSFDMMESDDEESVEQSATAL